MTLPILVIGFLFSVGQIPAPESGLTAERVAECDAAVKRVTDRLLSDPGWDGRGTLMRDTNTCRAALRARGVIHALASRRSPHHIEAARVRSGTAAARGIVETFNREGLRARFESSDLELLDAFAIALAAETCLARDNAGKASVAARQALEMFNRLGADSDYPFGTGEAVEECLEKKR